MQSTLRAQAFEDAAALRTAEPAGLVAELLGLAEEELDIPETREVEFDEGEEAILGSGEGVVGEEFDEVAEVVAAVEGEPVDVSLADEAGIGEAGAEGAVVDAGFFVAVEIDAAAFE